MFKFILVLGLMVTTLLPSAISSKELHNEVNVGVLTKDLISEKVQSMQVTRVKQEFNYKVITDFSGSEYILTELERQGYLIFCESTGVFVEIGLKSPSPYLGFNDNLFYNGPTEYYIFENSVYKHTLTKQVLTNFENVCTDNEIQEILSNEQDLEVIQFINGESEMSAFDVVNYTSNERLFGSKTGTVGEVQAEWLSSLQSRSHFGYYDGGYCGYIALNILIAYHDKFTNDDIMNNKYWDSSDKKYIKGNTLTEFLINGDTGGTISTDIKKASQYYFGQETTISNKINHISRWTPFFNSRSIKNYIDDGYPVVVFGDVKKGTDFNATRSKDKDEKSLHAVLAYRYTKDGIVCHYGHHLYSEVIVNGIFGSVYTFKVKK